MKYAVPDFSMSYLFAPVYHMFEQIQNEMVLEADTDAFRL